VIAAGSKVFRAHGIHRKILVAFDLDGPGALGKHGAFHIAFAMVPV